MKADTVKKLAAAKALFGETSTTFERLKSIRPLLAGVHPRLDPILREYEKQIERLEAVYEGDVVELSAEMLPEETERDKKKKAALLLFLKSWKQLQNEVARVTAEMEAAEHSGDSGSMWGKIFSAVKGPLGIVTVLAIGAAALHVSAIEISIRNEGCSPIESRSMLPFSLPGLSLPEASIKDGEQGIATLPPLTLDVDGTIPGELILSSFGLTLMFEFSGTNDILFDGVSLIGKETQIVLGEQKEHTLVLDCE